MTDELFTLSEAAARLRVSPRSIRREIAAVQVRSRLRVTAAELARYIASRESRCQSASTVNAGKLESLSAVASALSKQISESGDPPWHTPSP